MIGDASSRMHFSEKTFMFEYDPDAMLIKVATSHLAGKRRGSVVRTSVFGWRTFPDLCLIYS